MAKRVIEILPMQERQAETKQEIRAAAYCRVSTGSAQQEHSLESQMAYYEEYVSLRPEWTLVRLYADKGLSGTKSEKRPEFQRMLQDCEKGRLDLIITKSISRFARNTADCISAVRRLKELGIAVYFEKENINTLTMKGELMLTILSAVAQAEAEAVSSNAVWGVQYRFQTGTFKQFTPIGYRYNEEYQLVIDETEAEIVRLIYKLYQNGKGVSAITEELNRHGLKNRGGNPFQEHSVTYILTNEIYMGDVIYQKTYSTPFPEKQKKMNYGELPQYRIKDDHEPIISKEDFEAVQKLMRYRGKNMTDSRCGGYTFTGRIVCGSCGRRLYRRVGKEVYWICDGHIHKKECGLELGGKIRDTEIRKAFVTLCGKLKYRKEILETALEHFKTAEYLLYYNYSQKAAEINNKIEDLKRQERILSRMIGDGYLDPAFYIPEKQRLEAELSKAEAETEAMQEENRFYDLIIDTERLMRLLAGSKECENTFDEELLGGIVKQIRALSPSEIEFELINGLKLREEIERV